MSTQTTVEAAGQSTPAFKTLENMILGFQVSQLIYVAAKLGIADLLRFGPRTAEELARGTGTHAASLHRVLRALAAVDVFSETSDGKFELTPLAVYLQTDVPGSVRDMAILYGEPWIWNSYAASLHSVKTGDTAFAHLFGGNVYDYLADHPEASKNFNKGMTTSSVTSVDSVLAAYDFSGIRTIVDVGGGYGALLAKLLKAYPRMLGVLFDRPHVIEDAKSFIESEGIAERCALIAGNHLESVPPGNAYILKSVIEDGDDQRSEAILRNCRRSIMDHGKLLLVDWVMPAGNAPARAKVFDIMMLVMCGGRVRTEGEFSSLFERSGFRLARIVPTTSQYSIIEGIPF